MRRGKKTRHATTAEEPMMVTTPTKFAQTASTHAPVLQAPSSPRSQAQPVGRWNLSAFMCQLKSGPDTRPQNPGTACTAKTSLGSSKPNLLSTNEAHRYSIAPTAPMHSEAQWVTELQPAEMDTRPARTPLHMPRRSPVLPQLKANRSQNAVRPPAAADSVVFMATCEANSASLTPVMDCVMPQWRPCHPNHAMKVPRTTRGTLFGTNSSGEVQRPGRVGQKIVPTKATLPPHKWITPLPAKSTMPTAFTSCSTPLPHALATTKG
mmetsp:Transcript_67171/g.188022  ORF Transcript_67171/g.188022 Transcript_67171/m.188022 type:complete len:265 (+) Transcript_67171:411-1205(+)